MSEMNNTTKVAEALNALTYGEMMDIGRQLADMAIDRMNGPDGFDPEASEDWASILHTWAAVTLESEDPTP